MKNAFIFASCTAAKIETFRTLYGAGVHAERTGQGLEYRTEVHLLPYILLVLLLVFYAYPNWE